MSAGHIARVGRRDVSVDRKTSKALRDYATDTGQGPKTIKRNWLKLSHRAKGKVRAKLDRRAAGGK